MALISICTLSARAWDIRDMVDRLAAQTFKDFEWIIVDYYFDENKGKYQAPFQIVPVRPVSYNCQKYMKDIARNRNQAANLACGKYLIYLDDYSVINRDFVERHLEVLLTGALSCGQMWYMTNPDTQACRRLLSKPLSEALRTTEAEQGLEADSRMELSKWPADACVALGAEWTYTGNLGIPKSCYLKLNGFDPILSSRGEDCDFGLRAAKAGYKIMYNPRAVSLNLPTDGIPCRYPFDHRHPLTELNRMSAALVQEQAEALNVVVETRHGYPFAVCRTCGAEYLLDVPGYVYSKAD